VEPFSRPIDASRMLDVHAAMKRFCQKTIYCNIDEWERSKQLLLYFGEGPLCSILSGKKLLWAIYEQFIIFLFLSKGMHDKNLSALRRN